MNRKKAANKKAKERADSRASQAKELAAKPQNGLGPFN
jgi:hypothetical protein